jgi:hypothetical protein
MTTPTPKTTGWVGWGIFAAVILLVSGLFTGIQGIAALIGPNTYFVLNDGQLLLFDVNGWGWWNLLIGILLLLTSFALFAGQTWARVVAIILAIISAVGQLFLLPVQPWWATIVIAVDILVIYALTAHGRELKERLQ